MKTKKGLFRFVVLFAGISLAFTFMGCDLDGPDNTNGGNGGGEETVEAALPRCLKT